MNYGQIIAGSLVFLGVALFFYFSTRKNYYRKPVEPIQEYTDIRNKVTLRKKKEELEEDESEYSGGLLGNLIGGFLVILVGVSLFPVISNQINNTISSNSVNATSTMASSTSSLLSVLPIFFILGILVAGVLTIYSSLRNVGVVQ